MNTFKCSGKQNCTVCSGKHRYLYSFVLYSSVCSGKHRYPEKKKKENRAIDEKDVRYKEGNLGNSE